MARPTIFTPLPCSLIAATAGAALALAMVSGAQAQVLSDGGPSPSGDFGTVFNSPADARPGFGVNVGDNTGAILTQVNVNAGADIFMGGHSYFFSEVNFYAPSSETSGASGVTYVSSEVNLINAEIGLDSVFDANTHLNMSGGSIRNGAAISGLANVSGGTIGDLVTFGGTLNLSGTGIIGTNVQATSGSTINMSGGQIDNELFLQSGSVLNMTGGVIGEAELGFGVEVNDGSVVNLSGGSIGQISDIEIGGILNMTGGTMQRGIDVFGVANVSGGDVLKWGDVESGGILNFSGGTLGFGFDVKSGGTINISGGVIDGTDFDVDSTGTVNLTGTAFFLDGIAIGSGTVADRDAILTGTLLDGSAISLDLASANASGVGYFHTDSTLTVSVIPEPGSLALLGLGGLALLRRRR